eukprot:11460699-Ditylum_brightwellii.AAC.1
MERTEISANIGSACDATDDPSTVQHSDPYSTELDGWANLIFSRFNDLCSGITACSVHSGLEQVNKNSSSSSNEDYHQSDDGDHYSDLEE